MAPAPKTALSSTPISGTDVLNSALPSSIRALGEGLTFRQKRLLCYMAQGFSSLTAAKMAGYEGHEAHLRGLIKDLQKQQRAIDYFRAVSDYVGLSDEVVAATLRSGLSAQRVEIDRNGNVVELGPDWVARHKFVDTVMKMKGLYPDARQKVEHEVSGGVVLRHTPSLS